MCIYFKLCEMWHDNPDESSIIKRFIDYIFRNQGNIPESNSLGVSENIFRKVSKELATYD